MTLLDLLAASPALTLVCSGILGLLVGSFLNVVIYRLPLMLQREWQQQCVEFLQLDARKLKIRDPVPDHKTFNLSQPASHCPSCGHRVRPWHNIPVLSYLLLRGRCAYCEVPIHWRYPAVELATGVLSVLAAWRFGVSPATLMALVLVWSLVALTVIDFDHQLLPDNITLPLLWLGLLAAVSGWGLGVSPRDAVLGAITGYLSLWSVYWLFKLATGREGMGYGDFKLLAALGAWLGWQQLLSIIILSSLTGAVIGIALTLLRGRDKNIPMPFGPFLAIAGLIVLFWGDAITQQYLALMTR